MIDDRVHGIPMRLMGGPDALGHHDSHSRRVTLVGDVGEDHSVGVGVVHPLSDGDCEAGLAHPARPRQSDQPGSGAKKVAHRVDLAITAHQRGHRDRELYLPPPSLQRRELGGETGSLHLEEALVSAQSLHREPAELACAPLAGAKQGLGGVGDQDLAPPTRRHDPGGPMDVDAGVVVPDESRGAGVDPHSHSHLGASGPASFHEGPLDGDRAGNGGRGFREGEEQPVTFCPEHHTTGRRCGLYGECAIGLEQTWILGANLPDQLGRALDVQEQKRDRATGKHRAVGRGHPAMLGPGTNGISCDAL